MKSRRQLTSNVNCRRTSFARASLTNQSLQAAKRSADSCEVASRMPDDSTRSPSATRRWPMGSLDTSAADRHFEVLAECRGHRAEAMPLEPYQADLHRWNRVLQRHRADSAAVQRPGPEHH